MYIRSGRLDVRDRHRKDLQHGRSQVVRLRLAFRLPGERTESGLLLEPMATDIEAWSVEFDRFSDVPFMEEGRH
jgi:virulence-associated protein VagC